MCLAFVLAAPAFARTLPNIDKFGETKPAAGVSAALTQKAATLLKENGSLPLRSEPRLGVPTFLWGAQVRNAPSPLRPVGGGTPADAESAARAYLGSVAPLYNLSTNDISQAKVRYIHDLGKGPIIVKMVQTVGGTEIFHEEVDVVMTQKLDLVAVSGYITSQATGAANGSLSFNLATGAAATKAVQDLTTVDISPRLSAAGSHDGYDYFTVPADSGITLIEPIRLKKVYSHTAGGLTPGYYVEVIAHDDTVDPNGLHINMPLDTTDGYAYVISAVDGSVLFRMNLTADAQGNGGGGTPQLGPGGFTYRVWADPVTGIPYDTPAGNGVHPKINPAPDGAQYPFLAPSDVTLPNYPFSYNDPWLAPGATETDGNNVDAYLNLFSPDGIGNPITTTPTDPPTGDFRAQITSAGQFLHTHQPDVAASTAEARGGSIQQLFYNINFLHDWYYDFGFNEPALNAQKNNFGRGGLGNDDIKAQVQDFAGFNNANMLTPADGGRPRMRMYAFPSLASHLQITAPAAIAGKYATGISMSGPQVFDITSDIVIATFSASPACTITNAPALSGKIAMFDFNNTDGTGCGFSTRIARISVTGASSMLMVYTSASPTIVANITGFAAGNTTPTETISWNSGQLIKASLATGTVTARAYRAPDRDGAIDNQIVSHEWGHYLSGRLIGNGSGLNANYCAGMGEGWGDTSAMLLTVRPDDVNTASNSNWNGAYVLATYASSGVPFNGAPNNGYYYGVRRYPYSTDMNINPLTFKHIADGTALPVGPPVAFGADGAANSEVHNTGEVWAEMLWECYAALLRDTQGPNPRLTFQQAQDRWHGYLVASLMITPLTPTMLETRDAVLAAAAATDLVDFHEFAVAFAKRGAGIGAISPDRYSSNNSAVTESFVSGGELAYVSATLDDSVSSCDSDGVLDSTETGKLTVTLRNAGDVHLGATTAAITSSDPNVTIANGGVINFSPSDPTGIIIGTVNVALNGAAGVEQMQFNISFNDPDLALAGPRLATTYLRGNTNIIPASTATDTVEGPNIWAVTVNNAAGLFTTSPWTRKQDPASTNHFWFGPDNYFGSDIYLTSPVMTVDGSGSFNVQF
ncbi:MAG: hypothetical protein JWO56_2772, partial [Acidobacteria bacterium]|nr:hypothetical protein [Acidobacteriota bacterium]